MKNRRRPPRAIATGDAVGVRYHSHAGDDACGVDPSSDDWRSGTVIGFAADGVVVKLKCGTLCTYDRSEVYAS